MKRHWWILVATLVAQWGCSPASSDSSPEPGATGPHVPETLQVTVSADGTFSPEHLVVHAGDTVEWLLYDSTDSIIPATTDSFPEICSSPAAYDPTNPNEFTGPMRLAPSGVFALGPFDAGFEVETGGCSAGDPVAIAGDQRLCETGERGATMDSTWENPGLVGVFIRPLWNRIHIAPGTDDTSFDFAELDREIDQAVAHGKLYSLNVKAGKAGTPDWIFSTDADGTERANGGGGVKRLHFRDGGSDSEGCGTPMDLGNPTDPVYQQHYFDFLKKLASHLRARADRYRALAYIKPSGANLFSDEARLPKRCDEGCFCNTELWAKNGYTPSKLYAFYAAQEQLMVEEFPDKTLNYMLIQDGFPSVSEDGVYELPDGTLSGTGSAPVPDGVEQTETILAQGQAAHGPLFSVSHNGIGLKPPSGTCPNEGIHPATGPYGLSGTGCPNRWVLKASAAGQVTGFQTNNASGIQTPADIGSALQNTWDNSDGIYLELYEQRVWEIAVANGGVVDPTVSDKTLADWSLAFQERRRELYPEIPDPAAKVHRHTFVHDSGQTEKQLYQYMHGSKCTDANAAIGSIEVVP